LFYLFSHFLLSCLLFHFSCFLSSIRTNSTFVLRTMEDLNWLTLELEEERRLAIVRILQWNKTLTKPKLGCGYLFIVMIDTWCILVINNSYLNFKTYCITFIICLDRIVQRKLNETWESWKRFKVSWMGITWGNMEDGQMELKHSS
jgi:hypothetical protein